MSLRASIAADLAAAGLAPLHRLGQNFMIDEHALARLVAELQLVPGDRVVEVGPGTDPDLLELFAMYAGEQAVS